MSTTDAALQALGQQSEQPATVATAQKSNTLLSIVQSESFKRQMSLALPKCLTADRLVRIITTECRKTPELLQCTQESLLGSILQCAQLGLEPGSALGHCYLIPFKNGKAGRLNAQLVIGVRGMIALARRSGQIVSIFAYVVHEGDEFEYELGLRPNIKHRPAHTAKPGPMTYVYAVANLKDGGVQFEVLSRAAVEAIRQKSKAGNSGPWVDYFDEMSKKTAIRRLFKTLPVSIEIARAVEVDEKTDRGEITTEKDVIDSTFVDTGMIDA